MEDNAYDSIPVHEQNNDAYDILTQKKVLNTSITREHVEKNPDGFARFIVSEATAAADKKPLIYNITTTKEDSLFEQNLRGSLLKLNKDIPNNITLQTNGINLKLTPVLPSGQRNFSEEDKVHTVTLLNSFNLYTNKHGEKYFEIIGLSLEEQIDALSEANHFHIAQTELGEWQKTLKALCEDAKGPEEINQVRKYVEKTQAIIRVLNQSCEIPEKKQEAIKNAVDKFNATIQDLSKKDKFFATGLMLSAAVIAAVVFITTVVLCPPLAPLALIGFLGIWLAEKYAKHEINEADSPGVIARGLSQLGIFNYIPYKKTALAFSDKLGKDVKDNNSVELYQSNNQVVELNPVYQ